VRRAADERKGHDGHTEHGDTAEDHGSLPVGRWTRRA
jgi:hypothetical protein